MISELKPEQNVWNIAICVISLWIVKERNDQEHIEAIIQDVKVLPIFSMISNILNPFFPWFTNIF